MKKTEGLVAPNFFAMGYYLTYCEEPLPKLPVDELNVFLRKYLDDNFMLDFIQDTKKALSYSADTSYKEKAEAIEVTEEELNAEYELIATTYQIDKEQVAKMVDEAMVKADVSVRKAMQVVKDNVKAPKKASKPRKKKVVAEEAAPEAAEEAKTEE